MTAPLQAHLVSCTVHCLLWLQNMHRSTNRNADNSDDDDEEEEEEEGYQSELQTILESMTRRMIKCELEDFELVCIQDTSCKLYTEVCVCCINRSLNHQLVNSRSNPPNITCCEMRGTNSL